MTGLLKQDQIDKKLMKLVQIRIISIINKYYKYTTKSTYIHIYHHL